MKNKRLENEDIRMNDEILWKTRRKRSQYRMNEERKGNTRLKRNRDEE